MKRALLIGLFSFLTTVAYCSGSDDAIKVDKEKIEIVITAIKEQEIPRHYGIFSEDYNVSDITFYYPDKISSTDRPCIEVKWENETIYIYTLNSTTYKIELVIDLH